MKECVGKLQIRMSTAEHEWWEKMIREKEGKVKLWDSLSEEDYRKAMETFDLLEFQYSVPASKDQDQGIEYQQRNEKLMRLMEKKENHQPVLNFIS